MTGPAAVKFFAIGLLISATAACAPIVTVHGNFVEPERLEQIHEGISRKADVADLLGSPTATGTFDPNVWYYIGQRTEKVAFYPPEVVDRQVLAMQFDQGGTLRKLEKLDASAGQDISFVERTTPTAGKDLTFFEQMVGNVGRFSSGKKNNGPGH
jgi:outer membrane protein assembly factor BamE (lipoprotein component of BamABCDE complex)